MAERMITGSEIEPGMTIMGHCVLGTVRVESIIRPGFYSMTRQNGSAFTTTIPADSPIVIWTNPRAGDKPAWTHTAPHTPRILGDTVRAASEVA